MFNIFDKLVMAFIYFIQIFIFPLFFWVTENLLGFGLNMDDHVKYYARLFLELTYPLLSVLNCMFPMIAMSIFSALAIVKFGIRIWKFILDLIPLVR